MQTGKNVPRISQKDFSNVPVDVSKASVSPSHPWCPEDCQGKNVQRQQENIFLLSFIITGSSRFQCHQPGSKRSLHAGFHFGVVIFHKIIYLVLPASDCFLAFTTHFCLGRSNAAWYLEVPMANWLLCCMVTEKQKCFWHCCFSLLAVSMPWGPSQKWYFLLYSHWLSGKLHFLLQIVRDQRCILVSWCFLVWTVASVMQLSVPDQFYFTISLIWL